MPKFKIHGSSRRAKKRELSRINQHIKNFWYHYQINDDLYNAYKHPNPLSKRAATNLYTALLDEATSLIDELSILYIN